jgi:hypothetical protein
MPVDVEVCVQYGILVSVIVVDHIFDKIEYPYKYLTTYFGFLGIVLYNKLPTWGMCLQISSKAYLARKR